MISELLSALPSWLLTGMLLGGLATVGVAVLFAVGQRFVPDSETSDRQRIDGSARRRAEIRQYLQRIGERYTESATVSEQQVAFHLPERNVAITFDAQAYFRLTNADPDATGNVEFDADPTTDGLFVLLIEHEMPGHHLGRRLPFEVSDVHLGPETTTDPVREAFDTLDISATADENRIESAYRERVKEVHPDQGGDREDFTEVREAYTTALNHAEN